MTSAQWQQRVRGEDWTDLSEQLNRMLEEAWQSSYPATYQVRFYVDDCLECITITPGRASWHVPTRMLAG